MTQIPAGWYPDPAPQSAPGRQRYWDGTRWTEHIHDPQPVPPASYPPSYPSAAAPSYPGDYPQAYPQAHPQAPAYGPTPEQVPTTPDGQPLSGWWRRVLAAFLDGIFQLPLYVAAAAPVVAANWDDVRTWFEDSLDAAESGAADPPMPAIFDPWSGPFLAMSVIGLVLTAVYTLGFWRWKQATPGKLIVGVRIRRRDVPGPMPWSTMLTRWGFVQVLSIGTNVPILGFLFVIAVVLNYLWPLWDRNNQALHDKVARTNVVLAVPAAARPATAADPPARW